MPRPLSTAILNAKRLGNRFNLVHLDFDVPLFLTDHTFDVTYQANQYEANGLLLEVDSGAMTAGIASNDWEVVISSVVSDVYSNVLSQNLNNRWIYHYVGYFEEDADGINIIGFESKKFGQLLSYEDVDDDEESTIQITITGPLGNVEQANKILTNNVSQHRRWGTSDNIFKHAHETDFKLPKTNAVSGGFSRSGSSASSVPELVE